MKRTRSGMSLMEVLAATFVVGIGLLGALAVLPYGAFQVSKAKNAENAAIMLAGAAKIIATDNLASPTSWKRETIGHNDHYIANETTPPAYPVTTIVDDGGIDTRRVFMIDPHSYVFDLTRPVPLQLYTGNLATGLSYTEHSFNSHIYRISRISGNTLRTSPAWPSHEKQIEHEVNRWKELMTGPDDLLLTTYEDKRPDFKGTNGERISSGKFTWFFTMNLVDYSQETADFLDSPSIPPDPKLYNSSPQPTLAGTFVDVDVLGCHNRTPGDERTVGVVSLQTNLSGASMTLVADSAAALDLSATKYIFVTWQYSTYSNPNTDWFTGTWCRVVNASKVEIIDHSGSLGHDPDVSDISISGYKRNIIVFGGDFQGDYPGTNPPRALIVPGVLYHKRTRVTL